MTIAVDLGRKATKQTTLIFLTGVVTEQKAGCSKCSKIPNTSGLHKKAKTNSADPDQTASEEAV